MPGGGNCLRQHTVNIMTNTVNTEYVGQQSLSCLHMYDLCIHCLLRLKTRPADVLILLLFLAVRIQCTGIICAEYIKIFYFLFQRF